MGDVFERMAWDLSFAGRAEKTRKVYLADARAFGAFLSRSPEELGQAEVRTWVEHLIGRGMSPSRLCQHLAALAFLYRKTLGRPDAVTFATRNGKTATLDPVEFLERFLQHVLPRRFHKIRHGGLYADAKAGGKLERARALITGKDNGKESGKKTPSFHLPERRCPSCGGVLLLVALLPRSPPEAA